MRTLPKRWMILFAILVTGVITAATSAQEPRSSAVVADARARARAVSEYRARAARLAREDVVGHFALAQWCRRKGLPRHARWEIHEVLREAPDHAGAREALGQVHHEGRWLPQAEAMRRRGLVRFEGRFVRKYEAARLRHERERRLGLQHRANLALARLANPSAAVRAAALRDLLALAKTEKAPDLARVARRVGARWERHWRRPAGQRTGIFDIRLTKSRLLDNKSFETSLGTGAPVRLMLPRLETVSIRTTVGVPLGRGR